MSHVTRRNESCHMYEWVTSHTWMSHFAYMNVSCHTYEWVISRIWVCHVTRMDESFHVYESVMSHIWMSHFTYMNESCHTYEWVILRIWMCHVTRMNESFHVYECVMSLVWMSHVTYMNESCHTHEWVMSRITWLIQGIIWFIHVRVIRVLFIRVTWLIHMCVPEDVADNPRCGMSHSYVWHDAIHTCDMTHLFMWHYSIICVTRLIHVGNLTLKYEMKISGVDRDRIAHANLRARVCTREMFNNELRMRFRLAGNKFGPPTGMKKIKLKKVKRNEPKIVKISIEKKRIREIAAEWRLGVWVSRAWWSYQKMKHLCETGGQNSMWSSK